MVAIAAALAGVHVRRSEAGTRKERNRGYWRRRCNHRLCRFRSGPRARQRLVGCAYQAFPPERCAPSVGDRAESCLMQGQRSTLEVQRPGRSSSS